MLCATLISSSDRRPAADLMIRNAKVWTGDQSQPWAEAVAVLSGKIVAVGNNSELEVWRGPKTQIVDAQSHLLLPGFNDAHVHFLEGGMQLDTFSSMTRLAHRNLPGESQKEPKPRHKVNGYSAVTGMRPSGARRNYLTGR